MSQLSQQKGLLLINLGTPQEPTRLALRNYLVEFLSDNRVIELPAIFWKPLLKAVILPIRSKRSARLYQTIWTDEGSPLLVYSKKIAKKVQEALGSTFKVVLSMRYGEPSIRSGLAVLKEEGVQSLVVLPLYPQYAAATTASCFDVIATILREWRFIPNLQFISSYFEHPMYINALANKIRHFRHDGSEQEKKAYLLFSFHGLPKRCTQLGDPYEQQCYTTAHLIAEQLKLSSADYQVVFQSRFGKVPWLQPYCDRALHSLPSQGIKDVAVICPGFSVDCLETLEEIAQRYRAIFLKAGGENFYYIPALNDSMEQCRLIMDLVQ